MHTYGGATVAVVALVWYQRHSAVRLLEGDELVRYPWVSWWGALLAWLITVGGLALGAWSFPPAAVERVMVRVVTGSVLVYLLTSAMAGQIGPIQGFDDMQSVTGADLLSRGYFPWSDFLFIHGLFEDALRSTAGFLLFGHTLWATQAALFLIWIPLTWVGVYWIAVWASRGRAGPLVALSVLLVWASVNFIPSWRWLGMSLVWLLLGEAVRRNRWPWTALLTAVLFVEAVLVPEASLQVIAVIIVLVASDLVHRGEGVGRWRALGRTRAFVLAGLACTMLWCAYLATQGALSAFLSYYVVFGPGHAESGALPIPDFADSVFITYFLGCVVVAAVTLWAMGVALVRRRPLGSRQWVAFGAALTTALYAEKGLGRFDNGHLLQVVTVALPLLVVWVALLLTTLDDKVRQLVHGPSTPTPGRRVAEAPRFRVSSLRDAATGVGGGRGVLLLTLPSVHQNGADRSGQQRRLRRRWSGRRARVDRRRRRGSGHAARPADGGRPVHEGRSGLRLQRELPDLRPDGSELALDVPPPVPVRRLHYAGWAYDTERDRSVSHVVVVAGGVVVASLAATHARVDVAEELDNPGALKSGFYGGSDTQRKGVVALYAVYSDGVAHPLQDAPVGESLNRPGRTPIPGPAWNRPPARWISSWWRRTSPSARSLSPRGPTSRRIGWPSSPAAAATSDGPSSSCPTGTRCWPSATGECCSRPCPWSAAPSGCGSARVCSGTATRVTGCT